MFQVMYIVTKVKLSFCKYCLAEKYLSIRALNMKNELWKVPGFFATSCCCFSVQVSERWPSESKKVYQYCSKEVIMLACLRGMKKSDSFIASECKNSNLFNSAIDYILRQRLPPWSSFVGLSILLIWLHLTSLSFVVYKSMEHIYYSTFTLG